MSCTERPSFNHPDHPEYVIRAMPARQGGWFARVAWVGDASLGITGGVAHETEVCPTPEHAEQTAIAWVNQTKAELIERIQNNRPSDALRQAAQELLNVIQIIQQERL